MKKLCLHKLPQANRDTGRGRDEYPRVNTTLDSVPTMQISRSRWQAVAALRKDAAKANNDSPQPEHRECGVTREKKASVTLRKMQSEI